MKRTVKISLMVALTSLVLLSGCANNPDARTPLDRIEFGPDECGTATISGTVDVNGNPFITTNMHVEVDKQKPCPPGGAQ